MNKTVKTFLIIVGVVLGFAIFMILHLYVIPVVIFVGITLYVIYKLISEFSGTNKEKEGVINRNNTLTLEDEIEEESRNFDDYWERMNMSLDTFKSLDKNEKLKMIARHGWVVREKTYNSEKHEIYRLQKFMVEVVSIRSEDSYKPKVIDPFDISAEIHERFDKYE